MVEGVLGVADGAAWVAEGGSAACAEGFTEGWAYLHVWNLDFRARARNQRARRGRRMRGQTRKARSLRILGLATPADVLALPVPDRISALRTAEWLLGFLLLGQLQG